MTRPTPPPPPLSYRPPQAPPPVPWSWGMFVLGIVGGIAFTLACYFVMAQMQSAMILGFFTPVMIKIIAGIALVFVPRWRSFGIGLIVSVPVAILLFAGICFGLIAMN